VVKFSFLDFLGPVFLFYFIKQIKTKQDNFIIKGIWFYTLCFDLIFIFLLTSKQALGHFPF